MIIVNIQIVLLRLTDICILYVNLEAVMNQNKCVICQRSLNKVGSTLYCDYCERVAFPSSTSLRELKRRYYSEKDIISRFCSYNSQYLYKLEQRHMDKCELTEFEAQLYDALSKYHSSKEEMALYFEKYFSIQDQKPIVYKYFHLTETIMNLIGKFNT